VSILRLLQQHRAVMEIFVQKMIPALMDSVWEHPKIATTATFALLIPVMMEMENAFIPQWVVLVTMEMNALLMILALKENVWLELWKNAMMAIPAPPIAALHLQEFVSTLHLVVEVVTMEMHALS
jgi:hypothetical protein